MLSKTDFLMYLDAPMHLWAQSHDQLEMKGHTLFEQHLIQQGQQVEEFAREYIENSLLDKYSQAQLFWQPSYDDGQFNIRADALVLDKEADVYDLYEVKSSTSVKKDHEIDVTFQALLLDTILDLRRLYILHIDNTYLHKDTLDLAQFFLVEEITDKVEQRRAEVLELREKAFQVTQMPEPDPSFACTRPETCPCPSLCHPGLPERPIYNLPYIGKKAVELREMGIRAMQDIPPTFDLNINQRKHLDAARSGQPVIDKIAIADSLTELQYPLYFLDYETFNPAVPLFENYRPYEHIVFQYSLFVVDQPGAKPEHYDCLVTGCIDPAPQLVPDLLSHLGEVGSVIVWNKSFEAGRNRDLAVHCPTHAEQLAGINDRLYDLMLIFRNGHYVHPDFQGSASLKKVLPVLCPTLDYSKLPISSGEEAMLTWYWLQIGQISVEDQAEILENMKAYCRLDTYAMLAILDHLREL